MADTVRELILKNIKTTVEGITTGNGYANTVASCMRFEVAGNPLKAALDGPVVVVAGGQEEKEDGPVSKKTCKLQVDLDVFVHHDKDVDTVSSDELVTSILGDIEQSLMVDVTRGGYAIDTNITGNSPFPPVSDQPFAGIIVELEILYRHALSDPRSQ